VAPEPQGSSLYSQEPATGPYPEPTGSNLHSLILSCSVQYENFTIDVVSQICHLTVSLSLTLTLMRIQFSYRIRSEPVRDWPRGSNWSASLKTPKMRRGTFERFKIRGTASFGFVEVGPTFQTCVLRPLWVTSATSMHLWNVDLLLRDYTSRILEELQKSKRIEFWIIPLRLRAILLDLEAIFFFSVPVCVITASG
jgi:hypothetical protein